MSDDSTIRDKTGVLERLSAMPRVVLEFGCGPSKKRADWLGVDALDYPGVDLVGDAFEVCAELPASSADEVHSFHFLEHVADVPAMLDAWARILKPGALLHIVVPHFSNPYFYSDPTHRTPFGLYTMSYYADDALLRRKVPGYARRGTYRLTGIRLGFRGDRAFPVRHGVRRYIVGPLVNLGRWTREFWEENLSGLVGCYEVDYQLVRL